MVSAFVGKNSRPAVLAAGRALNTSDAVPPELPPPRTVNAPPLEDTRSAPSEQRLKMIVSFAPESREDVAHFTTTCFVRVV